MKMVNWIGQLDHGTGSSCEYGLVRHLDGSRVQVVEMHRFRFAQVQVVKMVRVSQLDHGTGSSCEDGYLDRSVGSGHKFKFKL